ncbi:MAG: hypothetical protein ABIJ91_01540 [Candidatus Kuenenbacteria bacterium]
MPRRAWQIVAKSALSASPAGEATAPQVRKTSKNSEIVNWRYLLVEILTFFEQNSESVKSAKSVGIKSYYYDPEKKDLEALKKFLTENF